MSRDIEDQICTASGRIMGFRCVCQSSSRGPTACAEDALLSGVSESAT